MFKETGPEHFSGRSDETIMNIEDLMRKIDIIQKEIDINDIGDFYIIKFE